MSDSDPPPTTSSEVPPASNAVQTPDLNNLLGPMFLNMQATLQSLVSDVAFLKTTPSVPVEPSIVRAVDPMPIPVATEVREPLSFNFTCFDPNKSNYPAQEWLSEVNRVRIKYKVDDCLAILKAGEALRGEGRRFYDGWAPLTRTWDAFEQDLLAAFPDHESWGTKFRKANEVKCSQFETFSEYARIKIRDLYRFHSELPWEKVLSIVVDGINSNSVYESVRLQNPANLTELMLILRRHEAIKRRNQMSDQIDDMSKPSKRRRVESRFSGKCYNCGKTGHKKEECRLLSANSETSNKKSNSSKKHNTECSFCKRMGHEEKNCWKKNGKPKVLCVNIRRCAIMPRATVPYENQFQSFSYLVDSGADTSVIHEHVVRQINGNIVPQDMPLTGLGNEIVPTLGRCTLLVTLQEATIEIDFAVVPNSTIPEVDALIGWEVISRPGLEIVRRDHGIDLCLKTSVGNRICSAQKINVSGLDERQKMILDQILKKVRTAAPSVVTTGKLKIQLTDDIPVVFRPRRLAYSERIQVKKIIEDMLKEGIIRESSSPYASPIVLVQKKNGSLRLCCDFRSINQKAVKDRFPLPNLHDQLDALGKAKYFTTLDMKSGFHQIEVDEDSKRYTAFVTPDGHYEYNRMPFGFANAPACYQRAINKALGNLKDNVAQVYLDDVMIATKTIKEGLINLRQVLDALTKSGFSLNWEKCVFFATETEYLGTIVGNGVIKPSPRKVEALTKTPAPADVKGVRQLMGLAGYFRKFIKGFSLLTAPISQLLKKHVVFEWTDVHENIRQEIITKLTTQPVLKIFDPDLPTELHTDASSLGIAAALMQKEKGIIYPVAYFSRRTTDCESKYHSYDLETLAIVEGVEHFRVYLYGINFIIYTDCNSVRATAIKKNLHPRVARWWMRLQDFNFKIEYRQGSKMGHVDYLSRCPILPVKRKTKTSSKVKTIKEYQAEDTFCQQLHKELLNGFLIKNGVVYQTVKKPTKTDDGFRCFVPVSARLAVMKTYHDDAAHIGWDKSIARLRDELYWPRMGQTLKKYIKNCRICTVNKSHTGKKRGLYQLGEKATKPFQVWHIDLAGPLVESNKCTQILVIVDAYSKYSMFCPIRNKKTEYTIVALGKVFRKFGKPERIVADRAFVSGKFKEFLSQNDVNLHLIATGMPRGNGQVERVMRTLFNLMRSVLNDKKESTWTSVIPQIEVVLNETECKSTGCTPNLLMFGKRDRLPAESAMLDGVPKRQIGDGSQIRAQAANRMENDRKKQEVRFNLKRTPAKLYHVGDKVVVANTQVSGGKLKPKFDGPYEIIQLLDNERYVLKRLNKRGNITKTAAHEHLRKWPEGGQ